MAKGGGTTRTGGASNPRGTGGGISGGNVRNMSVSDLKKESASIDAKVRSSKSLSEAMSYQGRSEEITRELYTRPSYRQEAAQKFLDSHRDVSSIAMSSGPTAAGTSAKYGPGERDTVNVTRTSNTYMINTSSDYTPPKGVEVKRDYFGGTQVVVGKGKGAAERAHKAVTTIIADIIKKGRK